MQSSPKKNVELANGFKWHETLKEFLLNIMESFEKPQIQNSLRRTLKEIFFENRGYSKSSMEYLREYFQRNNSESGWASDKKMFGWKISQKLDGRIDVRLFVRAVWHNLLLI